MKNEKHWGWKGDSVSYEALHAWIKKRKKKPMRCGHCKQKKKLELANRSHQYKRDVDDYMYVCRKCHRVYDKGIVVHARRTITNGGKFPGQKKKEVKKPR